jgi:hypothetical protein
MLYLRLIIFSVGGDVSVDSEALLVTDFMNLKIKPAQSFEDAHKGRVNLKINPTQSFGGAHKGRMCVCVHRIECSYVYEDLHLYCVSQQKSFSSQVAWSTVMFCH